MSVKDIVSLLCAYIILSTFAQCQQRDSTRKNSPDSAKTKKIDIPKPIQVQFNPQKIAGLQYQWISNGNPISDTFNTDEFMREPYYITDSIEGVLCFRGNNFRNSSSFGRLKQSPVQLHVKWEFATSSIGRWGGGAGWTGQPAIVKWNDKVKSIMNLKSQFKQDKNFVEVIYASLDGKIYFLDLATGKPSRPPIDIKNPIKGSVSVDPRGYPLLYCGQGIPQNGEIGFRIFSLIDGKELYFIKGIDEFAYRKWGAFDSSPLINRFTDAMYLNGENGLFYYIKLNTQFNLTQATITVQPKVYKYRYQAPKKGQVGTENSIACYKNLVYFADNNGFLQCIDLCTLKPVWTVDATDDTDASILLQVEKDIPYLYTGCEVDKQGTLGSTFLRKIHGLTGEVIWEVPYKCSTIQGSHPVNGGLLASPILSKNDKDSLIIFSPARYKNLNGGLMVALHTRTGKEIWRIEMPNYTWSSPVDVYDNQGNLYLIQCDSQGYVFLIDGKQGKILSKLNLGHNIEASPAVFMNTMVVGTRGAKFYGITIR
ncbi:MAG: pyrrolo-quinoline quinone [Bacteroidia bacterium]|nr:pyrrolo-quinoline quinone [Bacteroidia bacterium]MDW8347805.1 pyrrolo-quinoline quinone [Bacteroidia bacterium]